MYLSRKENPKVSGVGRSLPLGGAECERSEKIWGSGGLPVGKFWGSRPSDARKTRETPFSIIFCIINTTTLNTKGRSFARF